MQYARTNRFIFPIGISLCIIEPQRGDIFVARIIQQDTAPEGRHVCQTYRLKIDSAPKMRNDSVVGSFNKTDSSAQLRIPPITDHQGIQKGRMRYARTKRFIYPIGIFALLYQTPFPRFG